MLTNYDIESREPWALQSVMTAPVWCHIPLSTSDQLKLRGQTFIIRTDSRVSLHWGDSSFVTVFCYTLIVMIVIQSQITSTVAWQPKFHQIALKIFIFDRIPSRRTILCQFWLSWIVADSDQSVLSVSIPYQWAVFRAGDIIDVGVIILSSPPSPARSIRHSQVWLQYQDFIHQTASRPTRDGWVGHLGFTLSFLEAWRSSVTWEITTLR